MKYNLCVACILMMCLPQTIPSAMDNIKREKRFLIVPETAPTRHQLIVGFGIPVGLEHMAVTVGYVLKAQYYLPVNLEDLRPDFFSFRPEDEEEKRSQRTKRDVINSMNGSSFYIDELTGTKVEQWNNIEVKDVGITPLNSYSEDTQEDQRNNDDSRWTLYKSLEGTIENKGFDGHECLLQSICEAAQASFTYNSGIIGELMHVILTPSTNNLSPLSDITKDYVEAENMGKMGASCSELYKKCNKSFLELYSDVEVYDFFG